MSDPVATSTALPAVVPTATVGPLVPGLYVLEIPGRIDRVAMDHFTKGLKKLAPECRFLILEDGARIARVRDIDAEEITVTSANLSPEEGAAVLRQLMGARGA